MHFTRIAPIVISTLLCTPPIAAAASGFPDVALTHPNRDAALYAQEEGIVEGYADGTFRPEKAMNRAEFTKIIIGTFASGSECNQASPFSDVRGTEWFYPYLCTAYVKKFIGGYPEGTFKPSQQISFVEAAKIIALASGIDTSGYGTSFESWGSHEVKQYWYKPYVDALAEKKAIPPTVHVFSKILTRGEMVEMIYRLRGNLPQKTEFPMSFNALWGSSFYESYDEPPPVFDGCGPVSRYAGKPWYMKLENQAGAAGFALSNVSEACLAPKTDGMFDDVLIFIVPGSTQAQSRIYQFGKIYTGGYHEDYTQVKPEDYVWQLREATRIDDSLGVYKALSFGKRKGAVIPVQGERQDADGCSMFVRSEYDVITNTLNVTSEERHCG